MSSVDPAEPVWLRDASLLEAADRIADSFIVAAQRGLLNHVFSPGRPVTAISRKKDQLDLFAVDGQGEVCTPAGRRRTTAANGAVGGA